MKKTIYILVVLFSGILLSCNDFLDTMPDDRAEVNTVDKVTSLLVSAYPTNSGQLLAEMSTDNAMDNGSLYSTYNREQEDAYLWRDITTTGNDAPKALWDGHYGAIASANQALDAIVEMGSPASLQAQKGEALIARAYSHFAMANLFCLAYNPETADKDFGLPYSEKPETEVIVEYERGTMAELYAKINADIEEGLPLIKDEIYKVPKYHFNKKAAYAFAARFNLFYHKYDKTIEYADLALGSVPDKLLVKWKEMSSLAADFGVRSDRFISVSDPGNFLITTAVSSAPYVFANYRLGERYAQADPIIKRETVFAPAIWGSSQQRNLYHASSVWGPDKKNPLSKVGPYFEYTDKVAGIGYLHSVLVPFTASETLLCRAEAKILQSNLSGGVDDINIWLTAHLKPGVAPFTQEQLVDYYESVAYMPTQITTDDDRSIKKAINPMGFTVADGEQENLIQCILHLRRIDKIHEGDRWYDIKRYGIEISHNRDGQADDVLLKNDPRRAIQIPQDVIDAGLAANPRN